MTPIEESTHPGFEVIVATTEAASLSADAREIALCPAGQISTANQGTFLMDGQAGQAIVAAFRKQGVDVVADYEHSTLEKGERGEPAPAAGWITALRFDDQRGLIGTVKWTADAQAAIAARQYRYLSPVLLVRKKDSRPVVLHSVGLTNKPAIEAMPALLAASDKLRDSLERLALNAATPEPAKPPGDYVGGGDGGAPAATNPTAAAGDPEQAQTITTLLGQLRAALGLAEDATAEQLLAAISEFLEAFAAGETTEATRQRIRRELTQEREREDLLAAAVAANKLPTGNDTVMLAARQLAERDLQTFRCLMDGIMPMVPSGRITPRPGESGASDAERESVIRTARQKYRSDASLQKLTCEAGVVNLALREAGHQPWITPDRPDGK